MVLILLTNLGFTGFNIKRLLIPATQHLSKYIEYPLVIITMSGSRVTRNRNKSTVPVVIAYEEEPPVLAKSIEVLPSKNELKVRKRSRIREKSEESTVQLRLNSEERDPIQILLKKGGFDHLLKKTPEVVAEPKLSESDVNVSSPLHNDTFVVSTSDQAQAKGSKKERSKFTKVNDTNTSKLNSDSEDGKSEVLASTGSMSSKERKTETSSKKWKWEPIEWRQVLKYIQIMREGKDAPVDTMGCERTMEENVEPKVRRYQALISLMLSSQTKDQVTFAAMERLKTHGLTVQNILNIEEEVLGKLIIPVGFWKKKANYIKRSTAILREKYDDDIPDSIDGLCSLPGVGQKMAYICMNVAFGKNAGIGVDTHVHRIANRLKWTGQTETKTPDKTRVALESWIPEELWQEVNILLVGFGQKICLPINPKCGGCLANQYCPYGIVELTGGHKNKKTG